MLLFGARSHCANVFVSPHAGDEAIPGPDALCAIIGLALRQANNSNKQHPLSVPGWGKSRNRSPAVHGQFDGPGPSAKARVTFSRQQRADPLRWPRRPERRCERTCLSSPRCRRAGPHDANRRSTLRWPDRDHFPPPDFVTGRRGKSDRRCMAEPPRRCLCRYRERSAWGAQNRTQSNVDMARGRSVLKELSSNIQSSQRRAATHRIRAYRASGD